MLRSPRDFFKPKVVGAPEPSAIPVLAFADDPLFDPSKPQDGGKVPDIAKTVDIMLGNWKDAVPIDRKAEAAREGLVQIGKNVISATPSSGPASTARTALGSSTI